MLTRAFRYQYLCLILLLSAIGAIPGAAVPAEQVEAAELQQTTIYLPLIAGSATSEQLIEQDRAAGRITAETALTYRVFALFGDPRLPAQYKGNDTGATESSAMIDVAAQFAQLSPATQDVLKPFLIAPFYEASWLGQRENAANATLASGAADQSAKRCFEEKNNADMPIDQDWSYIDSAKSPVRIWWNKGVVSQQKQAQQFLTEIDSIWQKLTDLLGKQPPSDDGATKLCRGGDNRLDITITDVLPANVLGRAVPFGKPATPSYILVRSNTDKATLAHEVMHAFQFAFPLKSSYSEYLWWYEATATWAEHYIYPELNSEHGFAQGMLDVPEQPLETYAYGGRHQYGAYIFPLFMQLSGYNDIVRKSFEGFAGQENSLKAINAVIPQGFEKQWRFFAQANWNAEPTTLYKTKDKLASVAKTTSKANLTANISYPLTGNVPHLGARYYHFTITDPNVRDITFYNGLGFRLSKKPFRDMHINGDGPIDGEALMWEDIPENDRRGLHIMAMLKINGQWQMNQDWTNEPYKNFCRDTTAERIEELVLIVSNSEWEDRKYEIKPQGEAPTLVTSNLGCYQWTGKTSYVNDKVGIHQIYDVTKGENIVLQRQPLTVQKHTSGASYLSYSSFVPVGGKIWTQQESTAPTEAGGTCSAEGEKYDVTPTARDGALILYSHALSVGKGTRIYFGGAENRTEFTMHNTAGGCPDGEGLVGVWFYVPYWEQRALAASGVTIVGKYTTDTLQIDWSFIARRQ